MKKLIFTLLIFVTCSNCALLSAPGPSDFQISKKDNEMTKIQASVLEVKYVNSPKESIIDELGKPHEIIHRGYSYFRDSNCHKTGCPEGKSNEVWIYQFRGKDERGMYSYEIWVYIKEGKIVRIAG